MVGQRRLTTQLSSARKVKGKSGNKYTPRDKGSKNMGNRNLLKGSPGQQSR